MDDEEVILDSFRKILVLDGYSVDTVETGQEALGLIQTHHYDFVFTDLKMPAMDGVEVAKAVKHLRPDIDVIIITGYATVETAVETHEARRHGLRAEAVHRRRTARLREEGADPAAGPDPEAAQAHACTSRTSPRRRTSRANEFAIPGGVFIAPGHSLGGR